MSVCNMRSRREFRFFIRMRNKEIRKLRYEFLGLLGVEILKLALNTIEENVFFMISKNK